MPHLAWISTQRSLCIYARDWLLRKRGIIALSSIHTTFESRSARFLYVGYRMPEIRELPSFIFFAQDLKDGRVHRAPTGKASQRGACWQPPTLVRRWCDCAATVQQTDRQRERRVSLFKLRDLSPQQWKTFLLKWKVKQNLKKTYQICIKKIYVYIISRSQRKFSAFQVMLQAKDHW